jgi:tRNA threonylcarbamoyladenosine biosynthesis protein TsaE
MEKIAIILKSIDKTKLFGRTLGKLVTPGDVICLDGDLGTGKTTLTQAIAIGAGVEEDYYVTSPSFNIFHEYPGRTTLYHMDFYRLSDSNDVVEMGLDEYFFKSGVTVIEWAGKALDVLPEDRLSIYLQGSDQSERVAVCTYPKAAWQERIDILLKTLSGA